MMKTNAFLVAGLASLAQCFSMSAMAANSGSIVDTIGIISPIAISFNSTFIVKPLTSLTLLPGISGINLPVYGSLKNVPALENSFVVEGLAVFSGVGPLQMPLPGLAAFDAALSMGVAKIPVQTP